MQQWVMNENFIFPRFLGSVIGTPQVTVKPNWQHRVEKDSILVKGVYVIKGHVQFDFVPVEEELAEEGIVIEHIDVEQDQAYFEYAIPFSIDFPNEDIENVTLHVTSPEIQADKGSFCRCSWQVQCDIEKTQPPLEQPVEAVVVESVVVEPVVVESQVSVAAPEEPVQEKPPELVMKEVKPIIDEEDFFEQLAEAYSIVQVHLNRVEK